MDKRCVCTPPCFFSPGFFLQLVPSAQRWAKSLCNTWFYFQSLAHATRNALDITEFHVRWPRNHSKWYNLSRLWLVSILLAATGNTFNDICYWLDLIDLKQGFSFLNLQGLCDDGFCLTVCTNPKSQCMRCTIGSYFVSVHLLSAGALQPFPLPPGTYIAGETHRQLNFVD